jgi:hypothetical protein
MPRPQLEIGRMNLKPSPLLAVFAALLAVSASGCAAYGGATLLNVPTEVMGRHGFKLGPPTAILTATGTRFHGAICRNSTYVRATDIHLDHVGVDGAIKASTEQHLSGLDGRNSRCTVYDVYTRWTIAPGDRVAVCAMSGKGTCAPST